MCNDESTPKKKEIVAAVAPVFLASDGDESIHIRGTVERTEEGVRMVLAHDYPLLVGWSITGREFSGTVKAVDGRILTFEE